jgi:hypothetical protein
MKILKSSILLTRNIPEFTICKNTTCHIYTGLMNHFLFKKGGSHKLKSYSSENDSPQNE